MKQYKINRTQKENVPSNESIKKRQNFGGLMTGYADITKRSKQPLYKNKRLFMILLLIGLVAYLMYMESDEPEVNKDAQKIEVGK